MWGKLPSKCSDYAVQVKYKQMSHTVRYSDVCKGRKFRHMAFLVLNETFMSQLSKVYTFCTPNRFKKTLNMRFKI